MTTTRKLAQGIMWTVLAQGFQTIGGMVTAAMVNRAISPVGRGIIADVQTWAGLLVTLFGLSLNSAIYHFANRERYTYGDDTRLYIVLLTSACASIVATAGMGGLLLAWPQAISMQAVALWSILLALPAATIFSANLMTLGVALGRVQLASGIAIIQAGANLVAIVPAFLLHAIDLRFALLAILAVQVIGAGGMLVALWRSIGCSSSSVSTKVLLPFIGAGLRQHIATMSTFVYTRINQLIVFHYCGEMETGLLAASHTLAFGLFAALGAVQIALYPTVIRNDGDGLGITIRMIRLSLYGGLILVVLTVLLANPLLRAYGGSQFDEAVWCFRMLVPAAWILSVSSLTAPYYVKAGAFGMASYVSLVLGIVSILSNVILVPKLAANGAAMATLLTVSVGFIGVLGMIRIISGVSPLVALTPDFRQEAAGLARWLAYRKESANHGDKSVERGHGRACW